MIILLYITQYIIHISRGVGRSSKVCVWGGGSKFDFNDGLETGLKEFFSFSSGW